MSYIFVLLADMTVGDIGLAIGQVALMTELTQSVVKYWADLESNMTSVERSLEYTVIEQEDNTGKTQDDWPSDGEIRFTDVNLSYGTTDVSILKDINFKVGKKSKIGIVGRTGAGKSSIISIIYRFYNFSGSVEIDQIDAKTMSLSCLR